MDRLSLREKEIFEALKKISARKFVVIGGYAVNAYTLPRFSEDCDIVVEDNEELMKIENDLAELGYKRTEETAEVPYNGKFVRYEKVTPEFRVSMDVLIGEVLDRQTNGLFSAEWIFGNASLKSLRGKTIREKLELNIINADALFVMKFVSCRLTDIRDDFLLISFVKDKEWVKKEVSSRCKFTERFSKLSEEVESKQFKDNLQGVFGFIDEKLFEKNMNAILDLEPDLKPEFIKELQSIDHKKGRYVKAKGIGKFLENL